MMTKCHKFQFWSGQVGRFKEPSIPIRTGGMGGEASVDHGPQDHGRSASAAPHREQSSSRSALVSARSERSNQGVRSQRVSVVGSIVRAQKRAKRTFKSRRAVSTCERGRHDRSSTKGKRPAVGEAFVLASSRRRFSWAEEADLRSCRRRPSHRWRSIGSCRRWWSSHTGRHPCRRWPSE